MIKYKTLSISIVLLVIWTQPANALFGSECKKPKASYENYRKESAKLQTLAISQEKDRKERLKKALASCKADFKSYAYATKRTDIIKSKSNCGMLPLFNEFLSVPATYQGMVATENSYRVVVNNQKCFAPELVIEAQRKLGIVK